MKPRISLDSAHEQGHEHDHEKTILKKGAPKAKAMNQKSQKVAAKAHRKSIPK